MSDVTVSELYRLYRPTTFKEVYGQEGVVSSLQSLFTRRAVPHAMMFCGPSGCGKTTLARICAQLLECHERDFMEVNAAEHRSIDDVRKIQERMGLQPRGKCRVWLLDEAHQLTDQAQHALLKMLEDVPATVYFMLATTHPEKLLPTIRSRCTPFTVALLDSDAMEKTISGVVKKAKARMDDKVIQAIVKAAGGGARRALVLLHQVLGIETVEAQIKAIQDADVEAEVIEIARLLLKPNTTWKQLAPVLRRLQKAIDADAEGLRYMVLGYMKAVLLSRGDPRAAQVMKMFQYTFNDSRGAGFVMACFDTVSM
jgi:DNA polymerase III gamma/tau subunit